MRICSAVSWVLSQEDRVIVLEDDCLPGNSFFDYCDLTLEKFSSSEEIGMISGCNILEPDKLKSLPDFYLSKFAGIWGWATWRRAWPQEVLSPDRTFSLDLLNEQESSYWNYFLSLIKNKKLDTWDYLWDAYRFEKRLLTLVANENFIKNIGFDIGATHSNIDDAKRYSKAIGLFKQDSLETNRVYRSKKYEEIYYKELIYRDAISHLIFKLKNYLRTKAKK